MTKAAATNTDAIVLPGRCYLIGATVHEVKFDNSKSLTAWIKHVKVEMFSSITGKESWFYLFNAAHMRGFIAHSETVTQGRWEGPGWYHTSLRTTSSGKWLTLCKGDIFDAFKRRFRMAEEDRTRFEEFILRLKS